VIAAAHPYHGAVGARAIGIGTTPLPDLMERITQLVPRGETEGRTRGLIIGLGGAFALTRLMRPCCSKSLRLIRLRLLQ
jgi:hypothetical protein